MPIVRRNALREACETVREIMQESAERESEKENKLLRELYQKKEERDIAKENSILRRNRISNYKESVYTEMLSTALKAVYITALEKNMIMNERLYSLSENLVDKFIKENGGATTVLYNMNKKTYLLDTIKNIVEDASEETIEKSSEEDIEMDTKPEGPKEELFDKLDNEEDVDSAIEIIADRISTAEEEFIRKNKEDKEKIEDIVNTINDRIKAVKTDNNMSEETKEEIQKECTITKTRRIREVYDKRFHTVFEQMVHSLSRSILKDPELKSMYTLENGKLDMENIVDCAKCMYGFLEFVNTIQLVKVDETFILKELSEM